MGDKVSLQMDRVVVGFRYGFNTLDNFIDNRSTNSNNCGDYLVYISSDSSLN
jgi:hypothetical protein